MFLLLAAATLPHLLWERPPETADALRAAKIPCISVPAEAVKAWAGANFCVGEAPAAGLEKLSVPGAKWIERDANLATATRAPWVDSNVWRTVLHPGGKYIYEPLPKGSAALAAAEAFANGGEAWLPAAPEDLKPLGEMLNFLKGLPEVSGLQPVSDIAVVNNGSPLLGEALNLMARRNLLFRVVAAPDPKASLNVEIGSKEFPAKDAVNPVEFAGIVRQKLGDAKRSMRIFSGEAVMGRLFAGPGHARIFVINYGGEKVEAVRVRVKGTYDGGTLAAFGSPDQELEGLSSSDGATEFTIPELDMYAVVDLKTSQ